MCKSTTEGGKRCLTHQAGTVATARYVARKLDISEPEVRESIKELNKEGRNLPAPSQEEVGGFLAREEFKTKLDPELSEHDRKIILKNYDKARKQAEAQGVTGGAFHAWKNAFARSYGKLKRSLLAVGAAGTVALSLAACGGLQGTPTPSTDGQPQPTQPTVSQPAQPGQMEDIYPEDATVPLEQVTDEFGTYTHVTVDPESTLGSYDSATVVGDLGAQGFTEDDARRAHELASRFFVEQTIDSPAFDNSNVTAEAWFEEQAGQTISSQWYSAEDFQGTEFSGLVLNSNLPDPGETRPGGQRSEITGTVTGIFPTAANDGQSVIMVAVEGTSRAPLTDAAVQQWMEKAGANMDEMRESSPEFFDGVDSGGIQTNLTATYTFSVQDLKDGLISGHNADHEVSPYSY